MPYRACDPPAGQIDPVNSYTSQGGNVRVTAGLFGLGLVASFGVAYAMPRTASSAAPASGSDHVEKKHDDLPNPLEDKRRALRETGLRSVLNGDAKAVQKNGSTVVKVGKGFSPADAAAQHNKNAGTARNGQGQKAKKIDQYVELKQERADKIFVGATSTSDFDNYYIAGNRTYEGYDKYLQTGPYNFGFADTRPDWVEHYSYGHGLLVSYWDTSQADNNVSVHPGEGRNLPIDANPTPITNLQGVPWRARIQIYDAPFSLHKADSMTLHINGQASYVRGQAAQPSFDDSKKYWFAEAPAAGVKLPAAGVKVRVVSEKGTSMKVDIS